MPLQGNQAGNRKKLRNYEKKAEKGSTAVKINLTELTKNDRSPGHNERPHSVSPDSEH
jgi:hypothetical protein